MTEASARPSSHRLQRTIRAALPLGVLALGLGAGFLILQTKPAPRRKATGPTVIQVEAIPLRATSYRVILRSQALERSCSARRTWSALESGGGFPAQRR